MDWYKHYIGDFQRDTSHLSLTERGAYLALMHHYYATEEALPVDHVALCRIAGAMTKQERDAVKVAATFFEKRGGKLWHKRIEAECAKAEGRADKNREIAVLREAKKRAAKLAEIESRTEHETSTNRAQVVPDSCNEPQHENSTIPDYQKPDYQTNPVDISGVSDGNNSVVPIRSLTPSRCTAFAMYSDWMPSEIFIDMALTEGFSMREWVLETTEFVSYWVTQPVEKNAHQWDKTFLNNLIANKKYREANLL